MPVGSSPRLRGTADLSVVGQTSARFIPAPAGNGSRARVKSILWAVHPRACGERCLNHRQGYRPGGSSPRLRGTGGSRWADLRTHRFIPAPAGNGGHRTDPHHRTPVHPRACGERRASNRSSPSNPGSSPRLRGTASRRRVFSPGVRFIPAPAGNGASGRSWPGARSVHPRACGERAALPTGRMASAGSSPRLRGTGGDHGTPIAHARFIPAPAGNGSLCHRPHTPMAVHPRACGERD